jgi:hypothetical protein
MFEVAVLVSVAGPLFLYWVGFARMWMAADAFNEKPKDLMVEDCMQVAENGQCMRWFGDEPRQYMKPGAPPPATISIMDAPKMQIFMHWQIWVSSLVYLAYSILSIFYVVIFVPKVLLWIVETPIREPAYPLREFDEFETGGFEPKSIDLEDFL